MKHFFTLLLAQYFVFSASAQLCTNDHRFSNTPYFTDAQISSQLNVTFANAVNAAGNSEALKLDVYYPTLSADTLPLRPLILMVHGGGLISGDKVNYTRVCREFAKRGFVAVTVNYRLGVSCITDSISEEKAKYRTHQDVHAAFRFVVENAPLLRVDTSWMFIGGGSAGSVAALGVVYLSQAEWNAFTPALEPLLGSLNSSGNSLTNTFSIKGVMNDWGAMFKASMEPSEMLPMVSFHGDADPTVNIDSAFGGGCIQVDKAYGSRSMHRLLVSNGVCSDLSVDIGGGHGVYQDTLVGLPFRVGRAACFFKSLFCNNCSSFYQTDSVPANCSQGPTGLAESDQTLLPVVYPNPFSTHLMVAGTHGAAQYVLLNGMGQQIYSGQQIAEQNFDRLPAGVYFLTITTSQLSHTYRLLKQ